MLSEKKGRSYQTILLEVSGIFQLIKKYTEDKQTYSWHSRETLPFDIEVIKKNPEVDIFSEFHNVVLLIRIPDEETHLNSLVFIFLNQNPSNFGVTNSINPLTTDNKSIIAYLLRNTLITEIRRQRENLSVLKSNNQKTREVFENADKMKRMMASTRENYGLSLVKLCQQYLQDIAIPASRSYKFSNGAIEKIKAYTGDLQQLESMMKNTVYYMENLYFDNSGQIEIKEMHLRFDVAENSDRLTDVPAIQQDRYGKTISLLDRLENAALKVKDSNLRMTGTHVGKACNIPVSAPAITDALSNHKSKIQKLVDIYPERWQTIRKEFRPFRNILKNKGEE